jgi:cephalosporin-C deacetylase-like acetyl esterase
MIPHFDTAHLLKDSKATIVVEIRLADITCPSTSVYAAINQAKGQKIIYPVTYREHTWPSAEQRKIVGMQWFSILKMILSTIF